MNITGVLHDYAENHLYWVIAYSTLGGIFVLIGLIFFFLTYREICSNMKRDIDFKSQVLFLCAVFTKGIGFFITIIFFIKIKPIRGNEYDFEQVKSYYDKYDRFSILTTGLPGYIIALAYGTIFLSWCKICCTCLDHDSKSFFNFSKIISYSLAIIVGSVFIPTALIVVISGPNYKDGIVMYRAHKIEAICACVRDVSIALCFVFYLKSIWSLLECRFPDTWIAFKVLLLFFVLILRVISILVYTFSFKGNKKDNSTFGKKYFLLFIFEKFIPEGLPLSFIAFMGWAQCSVSNTASQNSVDGFNVFE